MKQLRSVVTTLVTTALFLILSSAWSQVPEQVTAFDPTTFNNSTTIDNPWFTYSPGMFWVYEGVTVEDGEAIPHRIEFTITDMTKVIDGVTTVVAWVLDYSDDELVETELAFYAQADDGTVWYFGEYPEEYEDGEFLAAKPWISGLDGARAGIKMLPEPHPDAASYYQGWGPAVDWNDYAKIEAIGAEFCGPTTCYDDVLVIAESSLGEDAFQLKYYARGVGNIGVSFRGEDATQETLALVEHGTLDPDALSAVTTMVLEVAERAREISETYAQTDPMVTSLD